MKIILEKAAELKHDAGEKAQELAHNAQGKLLFFLLNFF